MRKNGYFLVLTNCGSELLLKSFDDRHFLVKESLFEDGFIVVQAQIGQSIIDLLLSTTFKVAAWLQFLLKLLLLDEILQHFFLIFFLLQHHFLLPQ